MDLVIFKTVFCALIICFKSEFEHLPPTCYIPSFLMESFNSDLFLNFYIFQFSNLDIEVLSLSTYFFLFSSVLFKFIYFSLYGFFGYL